tara:strand:- start:277 stop:441 length:165 start_codon:yes stop_codon:yes gene_type:complete
MLHRESPSEITGPVMPRSLVYSLCSCRRFSSFCDRIDVWLCIFRCMVVEQLCRH